MNRTGTILPFLERMELDFFLVASPYTLADQPALDAELPACEAKGVGLIIGQPYASGILATGAVPGARYNYAPATPRGDGAGRGGSRRSAGGTGCRSRPPRCSFRCSTRWSPR